MATMTSLNYDQTSTSQDEPFGKVLETGDGRVFRFGKAGSVALARGKLCVAPTNVDNHNDLSWETAPSAGDTQVTVTLGATAATADQYKDGWLVVQDGTGEGRAYAIEGNDAADASGTITIDLKEAIDTAGAASESNVDLVPNPYNGVVVSATDQQDLPVGVPIVAIAASEYGWFQTGGPCAVLQDAAVTNGQIVTIGAGTAGAVELRDADTEPNVGVAMGRVGATTTVDGEYHLIDLAIDRPSGH